jgi:hypothetical protein
LAGLLVGRLEQTSVRLYGHGGPRSPIVTSHPVHTGSSEVSSDGKH